MQRGDRPGAELDRLGPRGQQHPDGFTFTATSRLAYPNAGERLTGCPHRVDVVVFHASSPCNPLRTLNLDDAFAVGDQHRRETRTKAACPFDRPQCCAIASPERHELSISVRIRRHRHMLEDGARRSHRRRSVGVLVRVDTDDDIELFCQHGDRSLTRE